MSHFSVVRTQFVNESCLIKAIVDTGYPEAGIERHTTPVALTNWYDTRPQQAHLVLRQAHTRGYSDIGFLRGADGVYAAIIDESSHGVGGAAWLQRVAQRYAYHVAVEQLVEQGFSLIEERQENGDLVLTLTR